MKKRMMDQRFNRKHLVRMADAYQKPDESPWRVDWTAVAVWLGLWIFGCLIIAVVAMGAWIAVQGMIWAVSDLMHVYGPSTGAP